MKSKFFSLYDTFVILMILYLYSTFFYKIFPFLNSLLGIPIILTVFLFYISKFRKKDFFIFMVAIFYVIVSVIFNDGFSIFQEHTVHLLSTILLMYKLVETNNVQKLLVSLNKYKKVISFSLFVIVLVNLLMLKSGKYMTINTGDTVYSGLSNGSHTMASISCMALMMILAISSFSKMDNLLKLSFIGYLIIIFSTGSRVYLLVLLSILYYLYIEQIKKIKYYKLYTLIIVIISFFMIINSNMFERFISTANNTYISTNKIEAISSGRLIWWKYDLNEYFNFSLMNKLIGKGNKNVFVINKKYYGLYIWAHNDFIQILLSYGLIGLILYLIVIFKVFKIYYNNKNRMLSYIILLTIITIASLNGFYTQQHIVFCVLLMIITLKNKDFIKIDNQKMEVL